MNRERGREKRLTKKNKSKITLNVGVIKYVTLIETVNAIPGTSVKSDEENLTVMDNYLALSWLISDIGNRG